MRRLSIIISNYNNAAFVAAAVDSALNLDWPDTEVVVVDDGSTDNSLEVLEGYASSIIIISQCNRGQREACNIGFLASTGDVVVFLDADDLLEPALAMEVAARFTPTVSKVQVQMMRVDKRNVPTGSVSPDFRFEPSPNQLRRWISVTAAYPTPPGSGNVYARWFLERIFPLDSSVGEFADSACLVLAPFLGQVVTICKPLVRYRLHETNDSNLLHFECGFAREIDRAVRRNQYMASFLRRPVGTGSLRRSRELLQFRVADRRQRRGPPVLTGDGFSAILLDALRSPWQPGPESVIKRILVASWVILVLVGPRGVARRLVKSRYRRR